MKRIETIVLALFGAAVTFFVIYPPFYLELQGLVLQSEYSWIWNPITFSSSQYERKIFGRIDAVRLFAEVLGAFLVAAALVILCRRRK
jgi:hypothetical protein